jgi:hypothetical protein
MHINLVRVIHSIQNSCITYSTQNQHFAEMFTYSDNTSYNLNFYYFFQFICDFIYSAIIHMCLMSMMTSMEFSRAEYSADHSALFRRNNRNLRYPGQQWLISVESCEGSRQDGWCRVPKSDFVLRNDAPYYCVFFISRHVGPVSNSDFGYIEEGVHIRLRDFLIDLA